ncbi:MAG: ABC transporter permease [Vicinamibacteraceae bacterium]
MTALSTALTTDRMLTASMPLGRVLGAYASEMTFELKRVLRTPGFAIPFLLLPLPIYLFFGVAMAGPAVAKQPSLANYLASSWMVYAVMGPALFGVGCTLAQERDAGLLKLKRAMPAPAGAYIAAKMAMAMILGAISVMSLMVAGLLVGNVTLSVPQLALMGAIMTVGTLPFSAIGLFIGAHVSASAAPAIVNLIFLPMLWLSGLFFPLPKIIEPFVVVWPAFHLNQVALGAAGVTEFRFIAPAISAAILAGVTFLFGGLAIRRLARKG